MIASDHSSFATSPVFDCRQTVRQLWDYLDGALGPVDAMGVEAHLAACEKCPPHFAFERQLLAAIRAARVEGGASSALRHRVRATLGLDPESMLDGRRG